MYPKLMAVLVASCALAACVEYEPTTSAVSAAIGPNDGSGLYDLEPQGRWLLGSTLDLPPFVGTDYHFSVNSATRNGVSVSLEVVNKASLRSGVHVGPDSWFRGVIVSNGTIELQLGAAVGNAEVTHYQLLRRSTGPAFDTDVCGGSGAIPLAGVFQLDGLHVDMPGRITFACADGAAAKCTRWGYHASPGPGLLWNANQACTRMARADYCANGRSHTRMETAIRIADAVPGVNALPANGMFGDAMQWPPDPASFYFEAAWWPGSRKAGCLSRLRWQSMPIGGLCESDLPDPRRDPDARNCEDLVVDDLVNAGALTFVATSYNDLALQTWHTATAGGTDYVTTVRGYHAELEHKLLRPFADYHAYVYDNIVGFLLRKIPGSITDPDDVIEVYIFRELANNRMVLAAADDQRFRNGYARAPDREGYVFAAERTGSVAFRLYRNAATGDYHSTVDEAVPPGYTWVANIGWIMPREPIGP